MLVFTRKTGEGVVVQVAGHPPLTITFHGPRLGKCQLAFDGPFDYRILRQELTLGEQELTFGELVSARAEDSRQDLRESPSDPCAVAFTQVGIMPPTRD